VEAVYQQQNLKLTASQQLEQDQLNDDLAEQINVLHKSHFLRKQHQAETFQREIELLDHEKRQKKKDLEAKIHFETLEFDANSSSKLAELKRNQAIILTKFDAEYMDTCLKLVQASVGGSGSGGASSKNRLSVYNLDTFSIISCSSNSQINNSSNNNNSNQNNSSNSSRSFSNSSNNNFNFLKSRNSPSSSLSTSLSSRLPFFATSTSSGGENNNEFLNSQLTSNNQATEFMSSSKLNSS
jgi:hypothetical protein